MHGWDLDRFVEPARAFGWHAVTVDGHDLDAIDRAYAEAVQTDGRPTVIVARTIKGQGASAVAERTASTIAEMRLVVLDKPRHSELIERLRAAGARVSAPADGDVAGALAALLPDGEADMLVGIGGTPEGVMTACAVRSLGGDMQGRLAPQKEAEARAVAEAGLYTERVYELDDLVSGDAYFLATGVTSSPLLRGPWRSDGITFTESIVISAGSIRRVVESSFESEAMGGEDR